MKKQNEFNIKAIEIFENVTRAEFDQFKFINILKKECPELAFDYLQYIVSTLKLYLGHYTSLINELTTINHQEKQDNDQQKPYVN